MAIAFALVTPPWSARSLPSPTESEPYLLKQVGRVLREMVLCAAEGWLAPTFATWAWRLPTKSSCWLRQIVALQVGQETSGSRPAWFYMSRIFGVTLEYSSIYIHTNDSQRRFQ